MHRLQFRSAGGGTTTIDEQRVVTIGRGEENDIVLDSPSVSRKHAELRPTQTGWDLYDIGSSGGTWVDDQRVAQVPLGTTTTVRFGAEGEGAESNGVEATITIDLPEGATGEAADDQKTGVLSDQQRTVVPGGAHAPGGNPTGLLIRTRDGDKRFDGSKPIKIGRDVRSDVVADDPAVSRHHAEVQLRPDGWWFVDHSNSGSFVDGERVREKEIAEETVVQLGHPAAGYQVTLVPVSDVASAQRTIVGKRRRRRILIGVAAAAVVALVAGGVAASVLWNRGGNGQPNTLSAADLDRAKNASVQIIMLDADGQPMGTGSGSIISDDGLILTNAHVAKPSAKGMPNMGYDDPAEFLIAFAKDDDTPAAPKYRAKTVVADGYLDLAVVKITASADGTPQEGKPALPKPLPIGDSNALRTGDHITTLGYPGLTGDHHTTGPLTITSGDVSAFKRDYATNTERFWIDTTARIAHGNSGGASIDNKGELVAVNTRFEKGEQGEPAASFLIRPIELAKGLIEKARQGGDPNYVSPFLDKIQHLPKGAKATSAGWDTTKANGCGSPRESGEVTQLTGVSPGDPVYALFQVTGIPDDAPFSIFFVDTQKNLLADPIQGVWSFGSSTTCIHPPYKTEANVGEVYAVLDIGFQDELEIINGVEFG